MIATTTRPIEKLLLEAAHDSGCTNDGALAESLENAARIGTRLVDAVLDAEVIADEAAFFQHLSRALHLPFIAVPEPDPENPPHTRHIMAMVPMPLARKRAPENVLMQSAPASSSS